MRPVRGWYRRLPCQNRHRNPAWQGRRTLPEARVEGAPADVRPHAGSKMLRRLATTWCPIAACALALLPVAPADDDPGLVIGIAHFPPLVMEAERGFEGFDIDIWNEVSGAMGIESTFRLMPFSELLGAVERGEVDAALAGISVTLDREVALDFSHPYMRSGLRILTTVDQDPVWMRVVRSFTTEAGAGIVGYLAAFVLLCAHILYFAEHGDSGIDDRYFPGIFEAVWCVLATITTVGYGDVTPRRWLGTLCIAGCHDDRHIAVRHCGRPALGRPDGREAQERHRRPPTISAAAWSQPWRERPARRLRFDTARDCGRSKTLRSPMDCSSPGMSMRSCSTPLP